MMQRESVKPTDSETKISFKLGGQFELQVYIPQAELEAQLSTRHNSSLM
jgi:hypothetical protein